MATFSPPRSTAFALSGVATWSSTGGRSKYLDGTRVNGWLVKEERLRPGDTLTLGASDFVFRP